MAKLTKAAQHKAWSPEARAKAAATRAKNKAAKALQVEAFTTAGFPPLPAGHAMSLDAIPDRAPKRERDLSKVKYERGYTVTEKEYMFLKMAKMLLGGK